MKPRLNPVHQKGDRNIYCPHYGDCLDYAIEVSWEYWNCGDCHERGNQAAMPDFRFRSDDAVDFFDMPLEIHGGLRRSKS
jgi:hypothetical protein